MLVMLQLSDKMKQELPLNSKPRNLNINTEKLKNLLAQVATVNEDQIKSSLYSRYRKDMKIRKESLADSLTITEKLSATDKHPQNLKWERSIHSYFPCCWISSKEKYYAEC